MRNTAENRAKIKVGSIVQISHSDDQGFRGCLMVVAKIETWGCSGWVAVPGAGSNPAFFGKPWDQIEPTGGTAPFNEKGERILPAADAPKHHP